MWLDEGAACIRAADGREFCRFSGWRLFADELANAWCIVTAVNAAAEAAALLRRVAVGNAADETRAEAAALAKRLEVCAP